MIGLRVKGGVFNAAGCLRFIVWPLYFHTVKLKGAKPHKIIVDVLCFVLEQSYFTINAF